MNGKHTQGPWFEHDDLTVRDSKGSEIARINALVDTDVNARKVLANSRLIASAPELLDDLESRFAQTKCGCNHPACNRCQDDQETERIINKAKRKL